MPRRGAAALLLTTAALALLLSFKTPADGDAHGRHADRRRRLVDAGRGGDAVRDVDAGGRGRARSRPPRPTTTAAPVATAGDLLDGTVDGAAVATRWGTVQVQVTIAGGAITDVTALQLPSGDHHSADISARVEPVLRSSALAVQSAEIDVVSGATYTSIAYAQSLQAALDAVRA